MTNVFYVLGTSSGLPSADKATSGYLLKTGESLSLFDCGGGVTQSFLRRGFNPLDIDRIFISHTHSDHVCELSLFLQLIYLNKREKPLDLYLPEEFIIPFQNYLNAVYLFQEKMPFQLNINPVDESFRFENENVKIQAIFNDHLQGYKALLDGSNLPNKMQCFSYLIKTEHKSLLYTADLATLKPIEPFFQDLDYLLIETTHIKVDQLATAIDGKNVKQVIATHLGTKDEVRQFMISASENGIENLIVAIDGMEIQL